MLTPGGEVFKGSPFAFCVLYNACVDYFGISHLKPTPHGLRRGGATWHFGLYGSYDKAAAHGRWTQTRTAKIYTDTATAAIAEVTLSSEGKARLADATMCFPPVFARTFLCSRRRLYRFAVWLAGFDMLALSEVPLFFCSLWIWNLVTEKRVE